MPLEDIVKVIEEEGRKELNALKADGDKKVSLLLEDYRERGEIKVQEIQKKGERDRDAYKRQHLLNAELEQRKNVLLKKQAASSKLIEKVIDRIRDLPPEDYKGLLAVWIKLNLQTGSERIYLTERDRTSIGSDLVAKVNASLIMQKQKGNIRLGDTALPKEAIGGFILERGRIRIDLTFARLLREKQDKLELIISETLFSPIPTEKEENKDE
jgi:vacuolar-type H+-ATPase subunit E/Vma4